jgi:biotin synthase-like enzyme
MNKKTEELIKNAQIIYQDNFPMETCFERAIFFSWACKLDECCKYCYMSSIPKEKRTKDKVRSFGSLLAETILCKRLGWDYGFLSGGIKAFSDEKILDLLKKTNEINKDKIWINTGILDKEQMLLFKPYIKGIIGTIEILNPKLHKEICPSKPIKDVEKMFKNAKELNIDCGMTLILGLGETIEEFKLLEDFIRKYNIQKIHVYGLNPHKNTPFENKTPPDADYQAEYIAKIRIAFPKIDIQCGIWTDRIDRISLLLKAGANSISKLPALKIFGKKEAFEIEKQAKQAKRNFKGTLTKLPIIDWNKEVDSFSFDEKLKKDIKKKLEIYLNTFKKNIK